MKTLILIPTLFLAACASQPSRKIVIVPAVDAGTAPQSIRSSEQVKAYQFGRYADPSDRLVMHEAHPIYRIEKSASWNLRGDGPQISSAAKNAALAPERDALVAEVNRQKAATKALIDQTSSLNQKLAPVVSSVAEAQKVSQENLTLKNDLTEMKKRLETVEAQLRSHSAQTKPTPEAQW